MKNLRLRLTCPKCGYSKSINCAEGSVIDGACPKCLAKMEEQSENSEILSEVFNIINGERQDQYGKPEDNFQIIARFWNTYLLAKGFTAKNSLGLDPPDVAHMMTLFKMARILGQKPDRDNYRDAIGYLAIAADRLMEDENPFKDYNFH